MISVIAEVPCVSKDQFVARVTDDSLQVEGSAPVPGIPVSEQGGFYALRRLVCQKRTARSGNDVLAEMN